MEKEQIKLEEVDTNVNYIEALKELKSNSVNKADYEKLLAENKQLVDSLVNNNEVNGEPETKPYGKTIEELRNELFSPVNDLNNLQYISKALELRGKVMDETGEDIFVGKGHKLAPSAEDYNIANKVAEVFAECIEYAQGDSQLFTQELMRRTKDIGMPIRRR